MSGTFQKSMHRGFLATSAALVAACAGGPMSTPEPVATASLAYPESRRAADADVYHGTRVADPYRWMEQVDSAEVQDWVAAQNRVAQPYLESIPARERIRERLTALWRYEQYGSSWLPGKKRVPVQKNGRYFLVQKAPDQDQGVLYWTPSLDAPPSVLIDPHGFSDDATASMADFVPSPDGRFVAYSISEGGSDWDTWRVREVDSGRDLPEVIRHTKFTTVSWTPDAGAFYYSRYPVKPDGGGDDQQQVRVYRHILGTPADRDALVYAVTDHPRRNPYAEVSGDGRWLLIQLTDGFQTNAYYAQALDRPDAPVERILDRWDGLYEFLESDGDRFYFKTTQGAPRGRVVAMDVARPDPAHWVEVVPEQPERLDGASLVGGHVIASYLKDARSIVKVYGLDGAFRNDLELPGAGTVLGFPDAPRQGETFFQYTDYLTPAALYRYAVSADRTTLFRRPEVDFDPSPYVTEQVFYQSRDGTRVPMFITRRKDAKLDGDHPAILYGYGGFDISLSPTYSPTVAAWLDLGGIYAVANLRGGGEYGEAWHSAGTKTAKQNVFDDFIAAAEWLQKNGYTSPRRLGILGRSNGGLLVGAVMAQRPELFGAALPAVGVLDMLRYHTASANAYQWSSDFGTVEDPAGFAALAAYSPVHNLRAGACYPPTLVTAADRDDRVVPWHSFKFAATLQHAQGCANPVLIRVETRAGHGAGKPAWMQIEDYADQWAFLARHLGME